MSTKLSKADASSARFFLRIGQAGHAAKVYDEYTRPLFPLWLIMDAEGLLSAEARRVVGEIAA
jgi:hypothetical protein